MLSSLAREKVVTGFKQTRRAVIDGKAGRVYLAADAEPAMTRELERLCSDRGVACEQVGSMSELGRACGIRVGASSAAVLRG